MVVPCQARGKATHNPQSISQENPNRDLPREQSNRSLRTVGVRAKGLGRCVRRRQCRGPPAPHRPATAPTGSPPQLRSPPRGPVLPQRESDRAGRGRGPREAPASLGAVESRRQAAPSPSGAPHPLPALLGRASTWITSTAVPTHVIKTLVSGEASGTAEQSGARDVGVPKVEQGGSDVRKAAHGRELPTEIKRGHHRHTLCPRHVEEGESAAVAQESDHAGGTPRHPSGSVVPAKASRAQLLRSPARTHLQLTGPLVPSPQPDSDTAACLEKF